MTRAKKLVPVAIPDWRESLTRHALSAAYADLHAESWADFLAAMKEDGFDDSRPIIVCNGFVLDGWQRLRACKVLGIEPTFAAIDDQCDPRRYVESVNDHRRHMTPEQHREMAARRRERVSKARSEGKSFREIAESEGISPTQAKRDADAKSDDESSCARIISGVTYVTPENANSAKNEKKPAKTVGKDGKNYAQTKTEKPEKETDKKPPPSQKNGKVKFSPKAFFDAWGQTARRLDDLGNVSGRGPRYVAAKAALDKAHDLVTEWGKEVNGE